MGLMEAAIWLGFCVVWGARGQPTPLWNGRLLWWGCVFGEADAQGFQEGQIVLGKGPLCLFVGGSG